MFLFLNLIYLETEESPKNNGEGIFTFYDNYVTKLSLENDLFIKEVILFRNSKIDEKFKPYTKLTPKNITEPRNYRFLVDIYQDLENNVPYETIEIKHKNFYLIQKLRQNDQLLIKKKMLPVSNEVKKNLLFNSLFHSQYNFSLKGIKFKEEEFYSMKIYAINSKKRKIDFFSEVFQNRGNELFLCSEKKWYKSYFYIGLAILMVFSLFVIILKFVISYK